MKLAPIILFAYNRPRHTMQTVEALQKNELAADSELFIYSDGPRDTEESKAAVTEVRKYLKEVSGFKKVTITESPKNLGLAASVIRGVSEVVNKYGRVIVLEDDLVTSPHFLTFMNDALDTYQDEEKVMHVSGFMYNLDKQVPSTFFLRFPNSWGWGTWKRSWDRFCEETSYLIKGISQKGSMQFNENNKLSSFQMLLDQQKGKIDSWAVRWYASIFLADGLALYPCRSLVNNVGFDGSGRHCKREFSITNLSDVRIVVSRTSISVSEGITETVLKARNASMYAKFKFPINYLAKLYRQLVKR
jgi:hypothetical protein